MPSELQEIKTLFDNYQIPLSMEWLESCIEWCKNDNLPPNYTLKHLQNMIYEQWLVLDLRDVEISSLPRNLSSEKHYSLTGNYYLQLMQVMDISKPKLWQLQRIRNNLNRNTDPDKDYGKRVLQLTLTDGVQEVEAMEFKPISCLNINTMPGTKLKITGPIIVRNGRLMLKAENVKNLGGSVDDLLVKFAAENVLARALGLPENPNPGKIDENILEVNQEATNTRVENMMPKNVNQPIIASHIIPPDPQIDEELLKEFEESSLTNSRQSKGNYSRCFNNKYQNKTNRASSSSPDLFDEMEINDDVLNQHFDQLDSEVTPNNEKSDTAVVISDDSFDNIDIDSHLNQIDKQMENLPKNTQEMNDFKRQIGSPELKKFDQHKPTTSRKLAQTKLNFASKNLKLDDDFQNPIISSTQVESSNKINVMLISKLKSLLPNINKGKFKIKGKFKEVKEKLSTTSKSIFLAITVKDESGELPVQIHSDIISRFAQKQPEEFEQLRELAFKEDKVAKTTIYEALKNIQKKLVDLDDVLELEVARGQKYPIIVSIIKAS